MHILQRNHRQNVPRSLQPTPEAAKSRLARLRRKQLVLRLDLKRRFLAQQNAIPPARDPMAP
jgi:hypothetical protein